MRPVQITSRKLFASELKELLGSEKVLCSQAERLAYSRDMSIYTAIPDVVVLPHSAEDVRRVMELACKAGVPVTPRGAGTSVTGAVIPVKGGIVLDLSRMNSIKEINLVDRYVVVEPGVICGSLNAALSPGYFFPPDPGSLEVATIGGMISTNASGRSALKYGTTGNYLLAIEAVLASGEIFRSGHRTRKASTGFDITRLFISAEGTLGVLTEATLRILSRPDAIAVCVAGFSSLNTAAEAAVEIVSSGLSLCACELMDCISLQGFSKDVGLDFRGAAGMLILEVDGEASLVSAQSDWIYKLCERRGAIRTFTSHDAAERKKIWSSRHKLISALSPHTSQSRLVPMAEDIGVPISRVPEAIRRSKELADAHGVPVVLFGHAGDGNIHTTFILNPRDEVGWKRAKGLAADLSMLAAELGGTISAEHGIGLAKAPFIERELAGSHRIMRNIKGLLDPHNLMNPGKLGFSEEAGSEAEHFAFAIPVKKPGQLASLGNEEADSGSLLCMMCGSCRSVCPVFGVTGLESNSARSKVQLAYALRTGVAELTIDLARKFHLCTGCKACERKCPSGIQVTSLVMAARRVLSQAGLLPPALLKTTTALLTNVRPLAVNSGIDTVRPPALPKRKAGERPATASALLFLGCKVRSHDRRMISSLLEILKLAEVDFTLLDDRKICCGFPLAYAGLEDAFRQTAARLAERVNEMDHGVLVTPCPACLNTFKNLYPRVVEGWSCRVLSTTELLESLTASERNLTIRRSFGKKVIYHDPCLLSRHMGIVDEPREILRRIPQLSLLEFPSNREDTVCCGGGSLVPVMAPEIASRMAWKRVEQALTAGAEIIATACPACKQQLINGISEGADTQARLKLEIMDIAEIIHAVMA